ncbi:MAG: prenyltransferase/squalene oxidase repeat-containing protein [Pirellulales bacterium]
MSYLSSTVIHLLALILLGVWLMSLDQERPVTLVVSTGSADDEAAIAELQAPLAIEPPAPAGDMQVEHLLEEDPFSPQDPPPTLNIGGTSDPLAAPELKLAVGAGSIYAGRSQRSRAELVASGGGSTESEAAVARGLRWLADHQLEDGSWRLDRFHTARGCDGRCGGHGGACDTGATGLALLPFLAAGKTHLSGPYDRVVGRGLEWLQRQQPRDGDLRGVGVGRMYAHAMATIALCEAYALTRDKSLADPSQRAIDFIVRAQHRRGGWRYEPGQAGDTSVVGWQVMALRSGQLAYLRVPDQALTNAGRYLDAAQVYPAPALYAYTPGGPATRTMTAEGLLCRQYLGWPRNSPGLVGGVEYLINNLPKRKSPDIYYWYYGTQVVHHFGGEAWELWNAHMRDTLIAMQSADGHEAGSWDPVGEFSDVGGRIYMTSLALLTLEVYYRHMPLYKEHAVGN